MKLTYRYVVMPNGCESHNRDRLLDEYDYANVSIHASDDMEASVGVMWKFEQDDDDSDVAFDHLVEHSDKNYEYQVIESLSIDMLRVPIDTNIIDITTIRDESHNISYWYDKHGYIEWKVETN
jgi:hypothetical protein